MKVVACCVDEYPSKVPHTMEAKIFSGGNFSSLVFTSLLGISPHCPRLPLAGSYRLRTFSNESHTFLHLAIDAMIVAVGAWGIQPCHGQSPAALAHR